MEFTFPFDTCERASNGIAQPFSTAVNASNCAAILYFLIQSETARSRILLFTLFAFEAFHTFSHAVHLPGNVQHNTAHLLAYCINAAFLNFFADITHRMPSTILLVVLLGLIGLDLYSFMYLPIVAYMGTQAAMFLSSYLFYLKFLPQRFKNGFFWLVALSSTILLLVWNEMKNCETMMNWWVAPYHIMTELVGLAMFVLIGFLFQ